MKRTRIRTVAAALMVALAVGSAGAASAQPADEWTVDGGAERRDEMIRRYRDILERRPERGPIFDRLLQEVGGGARFDALVEDYRARSAAEPSHFGYAMMAGHLLVHADRLDEAVDAYGAAIASSPDDPRGHRALADVYRRQDRRDEAAATYEVALGLAGDDDQRRVILRELADLAFEAHAWEEAGDYVARLVAIDPGDIYTRMELAEILVRYERLDAALEQYEAIIEASGRDTRQRAVATKDAGDVLALMGRTDEALERYSRALRLVDEGYWLARELEQRIIAVYRQDDRLDELVAEYEAEWTRPDVRQLNLLAALYEELGREEDAMEATRRALRRDPRSVDTRLTLIRLLERAGRIDEVIDQYRELASVDPSDASVQFRLVDVYRRTARRDDAVEVLDRMARRFSERPHVLIDIADRYTQFGEMDAARDAYERLVRLEPGEPDNYIALGEFHFIEGRRSAAERTWRQVLEIGDDVAAGHALLGDVFGDHGLVEEAVLEFEEARRLAPGVDSYVRRLARLYQDAGRLVEALEAWRALTEQTDQPHLRAEARTASIEAYSALGTLVEVVPDTVARFDTDPTDLEAGYFAAEAYRELGDDQRAEALYLRILESAPSDLTSLLALESLYTEQNRHDDAIAVLLRIAEDHPSRAREYYHRLAALSVRVYDDEAAVRFARIAVDLNPDDAQAHARLAEIYLDMQRLPEAVLAYRQALLLDPRAWAHYFALAEVLLALDRPAEADVLLREILSAGDDDVYALRAGRRSIRINQAAGTLDELVGVLEPHLYDRDVGETYLKLAVEIYALISEPLAEMARYGPDDAREAAAERLEQVGRRSSRVLLDALVGEDVSVRRSALRTLAAQGNANAALPLARLIDGRDEDLRLEAAIAVARMGDARAVAPLARGAESASHSLRLVTIWGLGRTRSADAALPLEAIAADLASPPDLRALALWGLGRLESTSPPEELLRSALADESLLVREAALLAAGRLGVEDLTDDMVLLLEHGAGDVPLAAARALSDLPPTAERVGALARALLFGGDEVRAHAGRSLARVSRRSLTDDGVSGYDDSMVFFQRVGDTFDVSAYFYGLLRWDVLAPDSGLAPAIGEFDGALAEAVAAALSRPGDARTRVLRDLDAHDAGVGLGTFTGAMTGGVFAAHSDLVRRALEPSLPVLIEAAESGPSVDRAPALSIVAKLELPEARVLVFDALSDLDVPGDVAVAAARAAARLSDASLTVPLRHALTSTHWRVRAAAARSLGSIGGETAAGDLERIARDDEYVSVRTAALEGILRIDPGRGVEAILGAWSTLPATSRMALAEVAARPDVQAHPVLERAAEDPDARVRSAALVSSR